jgi:hypothetical protein
MIIDKDLQLSTDQVVTVTAPSTDIVDQKAAGDAYKACWLYIHTKAAATAAGAATVNFQIQTDSDEAFGTVETLWDSGAVALADMALNSNPVKVRLPVGLKRYWRVNYVVGTGPLLTGTFDAFVTMDVPLPMP